MKTRNEYAADYDAKVGETGDLDHRETINPVIIKLLSNVAGKKILDLGCGQWYFGRILASLWADVTGVDISPELLAIAHQRTVERGLQLRYIQSDAAKLQELKNNEFDIVVSNMAFMDIENIDATMSECARVLWQKWSIVISMTNPIFGISERSQDDAGYFLKLKKYGSVATMTNEKRWYNFQTTHYHRPVGYYINILAKYGFCITNYEEIATKYFKGKTIEDTEFLAFIQEFPSFVVIKAKKNNIF